MTRAKSKAAAKVAAVSPADYQIEHGIPLASSKFQRKRKYPLKEMQPGDSFLIPDAELQRNVRQSVRNVADYYGFKVASRKTEDGVRFWRVQ